MELQQYIALFQQRFLGNQTLYATYAPSTRRMWQVKKPLTPNVFKDHLLGIQPLAIYPLLENLTHFAVIDLDEADGNLPLTIARTATQHGFVPLVETSRSKGYHLWFFFSEAVLAWKARKLLQTFLEESGLDKIEVFPKQSRITKGAGNCINLPLFGGLVAEEKTIFVNGHLQPLKDQFNALVNAVIITPAQLDEWLNINQITEPVTHSKALNLTHKVDATYGLKLCAQQLLLNGVSHNQRVTCFWLAVQLRKTGLPFEYTIQTLNEWSHRNHPENDGEVITSDEILEQTQYAYDHPEYSGCGCSEDNFSQICGAQCWVKQST